MTDTSAGGIVNVPTDNTGNAYGGDPQTTALETPGMSDQQAEAQALQYYNSNPAFQAYVQQNFGDVAWMLQNPELEGVLAAAAANQWTESQLASALGQTNWWKTNGSAVRQFQQLQGSDPASAAQQVAAQKATIMGQAESLGVQLTDSQLTGLATQAAEFQWNSDQIDQAVRGSYTQPVAGQTSTGDAATFQGALQQTAGQYLTNADQNTLNWWTTAGIKGGQTVQQTQAEYANYLQGQAEMKYPWMKAALQQGMTPAQYLQPYTSQAATTLSISPDQVDWSNPIWQAALLKTGPDGQQTPVNTDQFNKELMQNPGFGYSKTKNAIDQAYATAQTIETTFGKVAT